MVNSQQLEGKWNEIKGRLKENWGIAFDDELTRTQGNIDQFVGILQRKSGRAREEVERFLDDVASGASSTTERTGNIAKDYAASASQAIRHSYDNASATMAAGFETGEETIRRNPVESVAVCFGAGLIAGVIVGLLLKTR